MADITMSKTSIFSSILHHHHLNRNHWVSVFPIKSAVVSSGLGFPSLKTSSSSNSDFHGRRLILQAIPKRVNTPRSYSSSPSVNAQMITGILGQAQKWWEKGLQPNMKEVTGAEDLVESLLNAGDKLVVVDFFSPGCGGCRALHPKLCQIAEMNPEVQFLQVNYEEHKSMCYSLTVHVLPFFRFYRGAQGRLCSFSCTNATIKKFRDALAKHSPDRCSLGPPKGLDEKELLALAANKDLSFNLTPKPEQPMAVPAETTPVPTSLSEGEPLIPCSQVPCESPSVVPAPDESNKSNAVNDLSYNSRVESGTITFHFNPLTHAANDDIDHEQPLKMDNEPKHEDVISNSLAVETGYQRDQGESSFSMAGPVSGQLITYSGPITFSGSVSLRSESSTTSTRSFVFPVLQNEWNSSPIRMAKADRRHYRRHRGWMQGLFCCKF